MKYYVTYVKAIQDGTEEREITAYTDGAAARGAAYKKMGQAMENPAVVRAFVNAVTEDGVKIIDPINYRTEVE